MAKIGTAQVESIHIPDGAVSEYATGSQSTDSNQFGTKTQDVTIGNAATLPVEVWIDGVFAVTSITGSNVQGSCTVGVKNKATGAYLFQTSLNHSSRGSYSTPINGQAIDFSAAAGQTYTIEVSASATGGGGSSDKATVSCSITLVGSLK